MSKKLRKCAVCDVEFLPRAWNSKFCSPECKVKARTIRDKQRRTEGITWQRKPNCAVCGFAFERTVHNQMYCNPKCQEIGATFKARAHRAQRKQERIERLSPFLRIEDWRFRYSELEIIYLAELNPSYGIKEFCKQLVRAEGSHSTRSGTLLMLHALFEAVHEETGVDLAEHLDSPEGMVTYSNIEWVAKQKAEGRKQMQRPRGYGRRGKSQGLAKNPSKVGGKFGVRTSPDFNWGVLGPRSGSNTSDDKSE